MSLLLAAKPLVSPLSIFPGASIFWLDAKAGAYLRDSGGAVPADAEAIATVVDRGNVGNATSSGSGARGAVCLTGDWTLSERATGEVTGARARSHADTLTTIRAIASARLDASDAETVAAVETAIEWYETQRGRP